MKAKNEALAIPAISVIPAKAGIQGALKNWILGRASLTRNGDLYTSKVFARGLNFRNSTTPKKGFFKRLKSEIFIMFGCLCGLCDLCGEKGD